MSEALSPAEAARARSESYWQLAGLYLAPPDRAVVAGLRVAPAGGETEAEGPALTSLREALADVDGDQGVTELRVEHTRLFGGLTQGRGLPPPFESVHRESRLLGESTIDALRSYREAGFGDIDPGAGPQDLLGVDLKFLAPLCHAEAQAWGRGRTEAAREALARQARFLERHLLG